MRDGIVEESLTSKTVHVFGVHTCALVKDGSLWTKFKEHLFQRQFNANSIYLTVKGERTLYFCVRYCLPCAQYVYTTHYK